MGRTGFPRPPSPSARHSRNKSRVPSSSVVLTLTSRTPVARPTRQESARPPHSRLGRSRLGVRTSRDRWSGSSGPKVIGYETMRGRMVNPRVSFGTQTVTNWTLSLVSRPDPDSSGCSSYSWGPGSGCILNKGPGHSVLTNSGTGVEE